MLEVKNWKVYDLHECIIACRNAMRTDMPIYTEKEFRKGFERAKKLVKANKNDKGITSHANFRTGIRVSFDLKYTQYITKQFQRYHWLDYVSSSSLMHRITKMDFSECCNKYVDQRSIDLMNELITEYNNISKKCNMSLYDGKITGIDEYNNEIYKAWMRIISNCPMGCELFVRVSTNYEQLATIYRQRKYHKLKEDWGAFIDFIKQLPYAKELIIGEY